MRSALIPGVAVAFLLAATQGCDGTGSSGSVGTVDTILSDHSSVNSSPAAEGAALHERDVVSTDNSGAITFALNQKLSQCSLYTSSKVQVQPSTSILLAWQQGTTWCSTNSSGGNALTLTDTGVTITLSDPVFGVTVESNGVTVRVAQGAVAVAREGAEPRVVGPGQSVSVVPGQDPGPVEPFALQALPEYQILNLGTMIGAVPTPDYSRPDAGDSATLRRLYEQGTLLFDLDGGAVQQAQAAAAFVQDLASFWGDSWDLKPAVEMTSLDGAMSALASGQVAGVVTPRPPESGAIPFFEDGGGQLWYLAVNTQADDGMLTAARAFLRTAIQAGKYSELYLRAFDQQQPSFDALSSTLGF